MLGCFNGVLGLFAVDGLLECARNRGQANKFAPLDPTAIPDHS